MYIVHVHVVISSTTCTVDGPGIYNFLPMDHSKGRRHICHGGGGGGDIWTGGGYHTLRPFKGEEVFGRVEGAIPLDLSKGRRHLDGWRVPYP